MFGDQSEEGNGLASEFGDGGKRDSWCYYCGMYWFRPDRVLVPIFHRAKPHPDWSFDPLRWARG